MTPLRPKKAMALVAPTGTPSTQWPPIVPISPKGMIAMTMTGLL